MDLAARVHDRADELVSEVHLRVAHGAVVQVQVGAANGRVLDLDDDLVGLPDSRIGHVLDCDRPFPRQHNCAHGWAF